MPLTSPRFQGNVRIANAAANKPAFAVGEQQNSGVAILQLALVDLGFPMPKSLKRPGQADGIYGAETKAVVAAFQTANGLKADGLAGALTLARLDALLVAKTAASAAAFRTDLASGRNSRFRTD